MGSSCLLYGDYRKLLKVCGIRNSILSSHSIALSLCVYVSVCYIFCSPYICLIMLFLFCLNTYSQFIRILSVNYLLFVYGRYVQLKWCINVLRVFPKLLLENLSHKIKGVYLFAIINNIIIFVLMQFMVRGLPWNFKISATGLGNSCTK